MAFLLEWFCSLPVDFWADISCFWYLHLPGESLLQLGIILSASVTLSGLDQEEPNIAKLPGPQAFPFNLGVDFHFFSTSGHLENQQHLDYR